MKKPKVLAFYLPQYHPIKENNEWFGEGFTEWTNVGKTKALFKGHYQPKIPSDLGYYDLRIPEVREKQAILAKEAGIDAFCYYHYWFGNGRQIMEMPINEVVRLKKPDFPFCLCWANHSFFRKNWNSEAGVLDETLLLEQTYPGLDDITDHFYSILHILKDPRYYKINGKLVFVIYDIKSLPNPEIFIKTWKNLAKKENLGDFTFFSYTSYISDIKKYPYNLTDKVILSLLLNTFKKKKKTKISNYIFRIREIFSKFIGYPLNKIDYSKKYIKTLDTIMQSHNVIPSIIPNYDNTPRRGEGGIILTHSDPQIFKKLLIKTIDLIKNKPISDQIIFIKSWNEWGEGNYLEPDLKYGKGFIKVMQDVLIK